MNPFEAAEFADNDTCPHGTTEGICLKCEYGEPEQDDMIGQLVECYSADHKEEKDRADDSQGFMCVKRKVVKLGAVVNRADPTQTYVLECGHVTA